MLKYCVAVSMLPVLVFADVIDYSMTLSTSDVATQMVDGYDYVSIAEYDHLLEPGHPSLPGQYLAFVIPPDAQIDRIEVMSEHGEYLPGTFTILPAQKPIPTYAGATVEFTPPDKEIYALNELYPRTGVSYVHEGNCGGYRIASVLLTPLRYNPTSEQLHLTTNLRFRLHYTAGVRSVQAISEAHRQSAESRVRELVVNDEALVAFAPPTQINRGASEYVIITDPAFVDAFEPLRQWKMKKGVVAEIVTTAWIYSNYAGQDKPDKIRNYIKDAANSGALYFLLAGQCDWENNEEYVPRRDAYCWTVGYGSYPDEDTIPCDMYYSDLDGTWDFSGNGTYGEFEDSVDMYSNVFVGRAPVKDAATVGYFVNKVIAYEATPSLAYVEKALLPVGNFSAYNSGSYINNGIADLIPDDWQKSKLYEDLGLMSRYIVRDSIDQGFHLSHMVGHGNPRGIYALSGIYYEQGDPGTQTNEASEGIIVLSDACFPCAMDKGWSGYNYDVVAERMVNTNERCATATIMNSRFGWSGIGPDYIGYSDLIALTFVDKLFNTDAHHLGEVLAAAKDELVPQAVTGICWRYCLYEYTLLGDPEMPIWTDYPETVVVVHPPVVDTGPVTFEVTVSSTQGVPVVDARVCCYIPTQGPEMQVVGYTDASGTAVLSVSPQAHGDTMYVTVTKHDYNTYCGYAVVQDHGPYLAAASMDVVDADGNGQVNPGEHIELGIWARNWGIDVARGVFGYLTTDDPYAIIHEDKGRYGRIPAHDSVLNKKSYYDFYVASDCPNKHVITFAIEFRDRYGNAWISHPEITVYAPILVLEDITVMNDDNGNGALEPGESGDLVLTLKNEGDATAHGVLSLLRTSSDYVTILGPPFSGFGSIEPGASADNASDPFHLTADISTPYLASADFSLRIQAGVYSDSFDFTLRIGLEPPTDTGYYYAYWSGGPHEQSPIFEWVAIDSTQSQYPGTSVDFDSGYARQVVNLPFPFTYYGVTTNRNRMWICASGWICFWQMGGPASRPDTSNSSIPDADGPRRMVAGVWDYLEPGTIGEPGDVYYYYDEPNHRFVIEFFKVEHYPSGDYETFEFIIYDPVYYPTPTGDGEIVVQYLTAPEQEDITIGIENGNQTVGIQYYFDGEYYPFASEITDSFAIKYTTFSPVGGVGEGAQANTSLAGSIPTKTLLHRVCPNPFAERTMISYEVVRATNICVSVYDVTGRLVQNLVDDRCEPGYYTMIWDGCDDIGREVPAGVYFVNFRADEHQQVHKTILLK